jgi:hypothetical protein
MTRINKRKKIIFLIIAIAILTVSFNGPQGIRAEQPSCLTAFQRCLHDARDLDNAGKTGDAALLIVACTYGYIWCLTYIR